MEKAVGYVRISRSDNQENQSIKMQKELIKSYCNMKGLELLEIFEDEGVSGVLSLKDREGGKKALEAIKQGNASCLVGSKLDRLFRNVVDCLEQTREINTWKASLHLVDMGGMAVDTSSPMGRCFLAMVSSFAEMERELIVERTKQALQAKKARGERTGGLPYGFSVGKDGKQLEKNPEEQKAVRMILRLSKKGLSSRKISKELEKKKLFSRTGKAFYSTQILRIIKDNQK